jgi:F-type H+-transporting ATPase subunit b
MKLQTIPLWLAVVAATLALPAAAFAEGEKKSVLSPDVANSLTTLIVFALLLTILRLFAWKSIMEGMQKREDKIRRARDDAEAARDEAAKIRDELRAERAKAFDEAKAIRDEARRDSDRLREEERARTSAELQSERERLRIEIETAKAQALQEIWAQTVQLATRVSTRALTGTLPDETQRQLVERAITDLKSQPDLGGNGVRRA